MSPRQFQYAVPTTASAHSDQRIICKLGSRRAWRPWRAGSAEYDSAVFLSMMSLLDDVKSRSRQRSITLTLTLWLRQKNTIRRALYQCTVGCGRYFVEVRIESSGGFRFSRRSQRGGPEESQACAVCRVSRSGH